MSKQRRGAWRRRSLPVLALVASASALGAASSCSRDQQTVLKVDAEAALGRVQLTLTAVSANEVIYRLTNATFVITSRTTGEQVSVDTDDNPEVGTLLVELQADRYDVELQGGWVLRVLDGPVPFSARRTRTVAPRKGLESGRALAVDAGSSPPPPPVGRVDAELISDNPVTVTIEPEALETVSFLFRAAGDVLEANAGALGIGIEVLDEVVPEPPGGGCDDEFEPNDTPEEAAPLTVSQGASALLCASDVDFYVFDPGVEEGDAFAVTVGFSHASADIDAVLATLDLQPVAFGSSVTDNEVLTGVATGEAFLLQVFPFSIGSQPVPYTVAVAEAGPAGANSCCEAAPTPGCSDEAVAACVCEQDPFCCAAQFDESCVQRAVVCGAACGAPPESNCCEASDVPGCTVSEVHTCLCEIDFGCCVSGFDEICVAQAIASCGAQCDVPPPESDCCAASEAPGCTVPEASSCVCDIDPYCCVVSFDESCAAIATSQCDVGCSG